jgi:hypothetical protein
MFIFSEWGTIGAIGPGANPGDPMAILVVD